MRADNTAHLITAARQRHELTRSKAIQALRELDNAGAAMTFEAVARLAQISRSWLYTQPDIRTEIERLRDLTDRAPATPIPARQRTTDSSLLRRLEAATARNQQLVQDNQRLRRQLAQALGQQRATDVPPAHAPASEPTARRRSSVTINPRRQHTTAPTPPRRGR
jgi:hypothetical protein